MKHDEVSPRSTSLPDLKITLRANCLLTRRPLCFLTPPRSVFFYKNPWQFITTVLYEHGYKTSVFQLPFQNTELQKKVVMKNLQTLQNTHLIMDPQTYQNLKMELTSIKNSTVTVIAENPIQSAAYFSFQPPKVRPGLSYFLHQKWCALLGVRTPKEFELLMTCSEKTWHLFLDHCVQLAELDFQMDENLKN